MTLKRIVSPSLSFLLSFLCRRNLVGVSSSYRVPFASLFHGNQSRRMRSVVRKKKRERERETRFSLSLLSEMFAMLRRIFPRDSSSTMRHEPSIHEVSSRIDRSSCTSQSNTAASAKMKDTGQTSDENSSRRHGGGEGREKTRGRVETIYVLIYCVTTVMLLRRGFPDTCCCPPYFSMYTYHFRLWVRSKVIRSSRSISSSRASLSRWIRPAVRWSWVHISRRGGGFLSVRWRCVCRGETRISGRDWRCTTARRIAAGRVAVGCTCRSRRDRAGSPRAPFGWPRGWAVASGCGHLAHGSRSRRPCTRR